MASSKPRAITLGFMTVQHTPPSQYRGGYLLTNDYGRPLEFHYTSPLQLSRAQAILYGQSAEDLIYGEVLAKPLTERQNRVPHIILVNEKPLLTLRRLIPAPVLYLDPQTTERLSRLAEPEPTPEPADVENKADHDASLAGPTSSPASSSGPASASDDPHFIGPPVPAELRDAPAPHPEPVAEAPAPPKRSSVVKTGPPQPIVLAAPDAVPHPKFIGDLKVFQKLLTLVPDSFDWIEPFERIALAMSELQTTGDRVDPPQRSAA